MSKNWQVGDRIRREVLREKRAGYGEEILQSLSAKLETEFGRGFSARKLADMGVRARKRLEAATGRRTGSPRFAAEAQGRQ